MSTLTRIAKTETRLMLRDATSAFFGVVFPGLLLVTLALVLPGFRDVIEDPEAPAELIGLRPVDIYVPVVLALAIGTVGLTILPAYLAAYREQGVLRRLSTTPAAPRDLLGAQVLVNLGFLTVGSLIAVLAGGIAFDVDWPSNIPSLAPGEPDCGQPRARRTEDRTAAQPWARRQPTGSVRQDSFTDLTRRQVEQSPPVGLFGIVGAHHNPVAVDVQLDVVAIAVSRQLDERAAEQLS